jgi:hypothetical protein
MYIPPNWLVSIQNDPMAKKASLWGFQIFGVVLMIFAPVDVLSRYPLLAVLIEFISGLVPSINKWAAHSPWPDATKLFFTYCWLTIPVQIVIIERHKPSKSNFIYFHKTHKQFYRPILLIFMTVTFTLLNYYYAVPYTESSIPFDVNAYRSKLVQSLYGVFMAFGVVNLVVCLIWWVKNIRFIYFDKR